MDSSKGSLLRRLSRWSLAGVCCALLWLAAFLGGRDAGFDRGHDEGFAAVRDEAFAAGRVEGIRQSQERYSRPGVFERVYQVRDVLRERATAKNAGQRPDSREIADFDALIQEIVTNVAPGQWPEFGGTGAYSIRAFPTNLTLVIATDAGHHAEIAVYLESKDDYLAWKKATETR